MTTVEKGQIMSSRNIDQNDLSNKSEALYEMPLCDYVMILTISTESSIPPCYGIIVKEFICMIVYPTYYTYIIIHIIV